MAQFDVVKNPNALIQRVICLLIVSFLIGCNMGNSSSEQNISGNSPLEIESVEPSKEKIEENSIKEDVDVLVKEESSLSPYDKVDEKLPEQKSDSTQNNTNNPSKVVYPSNPHVAQWYPNYVDVQFSNAPENAGRKTLFAPGVSEETGWYDTNKSWSNDTSLCWAASASNVITWWLDRYKEGGGDVSGLTVSSDEIFHTFINNWKNEGYDEKDGVCWYFTGKFSAGNAPTNLKNPNSGGFLKDLPGIGSKAWNLLTFGDFSIYGNIDTGRPFFDYQMGSYYSDQPLYSLESFSRTIIRQLHTGVVMLKTTGIGIRGEHAITLWGCDYDGQTGLVSHVYITDSDDHRRELRRMAICPAETGSGVAMQNYFVGNYRFGGLVDAILLFPPVEFSTTK